MNTTYPLHLKTNISESEHSIARPQIVIIGGGAGGLELATRLGNSLGKKKKADIILVDKNRTHIWKPLLHEIAAGSLNADKHELDYIAQAKWCHFDFRLGELQELNRKERFILISPSYDENGEELIPSRKISYDVLVISIGSTTNDFGIEGVAEHSVALDSTEQAERFHKKLHNALVRAQTQRSAILPGQLDVVIVGAGATGVELAAELHNSTRALTAYGFDKIDPDRDIRITLIEASPRILSALPVRVSQSAEFELQKLHVRIYTGQRVISVSSEGVTTSTGLFIPSHLVVWSAGIKAPDCLKKLDGLEINSISQLKVKPTLQTTIDNSIFALGDCAECPLPNGSFIPPRAQSAHQQASFLAKALPQYLKKKRLRKFAYRDYGSLVNLGGYSTVGNLMGSLVGRSLFIEGIIARLMYWSLYQMHLVALHGAFFVILQLLSRLIARRTEPRVKLH